MAQEKENYGIKSQIVIEKLFKNLMIRKKITMIPNKDEYIEFFKAINLKNSEIRDFNLLFISRHLPNCHTFTWFNRAFNVVDTDNNFKKICEYKLLTRCIFYLTVTFLFFYICWYFKLDSLSYFN